MRNHTPHLTDTDVLQRARACLQAHVPLQADGYVWTTADLFNVLLGVAVNRGTIEAICAALVGTPDPETIRRYLHAQLRVDDLPAVEHHVNVALADEIPAQGWARAHDVASEFHDRPSYGTTPQSEGLWARGQATDGTTRFSRVATAYAPPPAGHPGEPRCAARG